MDTYDVAVLGGGPGGYVAAIRAAKLGLKTALFEKDRLGGTCLNRGCIPTKSLLHSAQVYRTALKAADFGVRVSDVGYDYAAMAARKNAVVDRLVKGIEALVKTARVTLVRGRGELLPDRTVAVDGQIRLRADKVIVATGSIPVLPPLPGRDLPGVMTSDSVLAMDRLPDSFVIVGGGVVGMEFASLFSGLGKRVIVLELLPGILAGMDRDVGQTVSRICKKRGLTIHVSAKVRGIAKTDGLAVTYEHGGETLTVAAEAVVLAAGRRPELTGLDRAGLVLDGHAIAVDERMRTNLAGVYAVGDCTGKLQLAHVASAQALAAVDDIVGRESRMRYEHIPACVYTHPEVAAIGLTEEAAKEAGRQIRIGSFPVAANGKSVVMGESEGLAKLIVDAQTGEILGAHLVAPHATDMIAELAAVMEAEGTVAELAETIHPHPTVSEIVMEAAHDADSLSVHKL
ncbi:MAG: dihydrolipoyl dehydrogenase [Planctomycetota bacterium]|nr:dihydrolipoyl dehydrogenase [Planctomycetota bacterium]